MAVRRVRGLASLVAIAMLVVGAPLVLPAAPAGATAPAATITDIVAGGVHACELGGDGTAACWGSNYSGALGNGTSEGSTTRVPLHVAGTPLAGKAVAQIATGDNLGCALATDATLACWGSNSSGQLGNDSTTDARSPVGVVTAGTPLAGKTVTQVAVGDNHACALASDSTLACWGWNANDELGNGTETDAHVPVGVVVAGTPLAGKTITQLALGGLHSCALASDGSVACWGDDSSGALGHLPTAFSQPTPVALSTSGTPLDGKVITQISANDNDTCAVASDGTLACWGLDDQGQLGNGTTTNAVVPVAVGGAGSALDGKTVTQVAVGFDHSCALASDGTVACWGGNDFGALGNATTTPSLVPVAVTTSGTPMAGKTIIKITADNQDTCAAASDGTAYCWGAGTNGELGNGATTSSSVPVQVTPVGLPGAPSIGTATAGDGQVTLTWTAPSDNGSTITGYVVTPYIAGVAQLPVTVGGTATSTVITGLTNGTQYRFTVAATNAVGTGPASSNSGPATPFAASLPGAPTIGTATPGNGQATVTWSAPASTGGTITSYSITPYIAGVAQTVVVSSGSGTTKVVTGLTNGTAYTFKVAATNATGTGPQSAASNSVTPTTATVPGAPTIGTASAGNGQATVTWTAPASDGGSAITGYTITTILNGFPLFGTTTSSGPGTSKVVTGLTNGSSYTFKVAAVNAVGTGPQSGASNAVVPSTTTVPGAPSIGTATAGNAQATVTWSAPASNGGSAITGYVVTPFIGSSAQATQTFGSGATSGSVTGLANGTTYTFVVAATNAIGTGPASAASNAVTPSTVPGAPTIGTATAGDGQATVTWSAPGSNGGATVTSYVVTPFIGATAQASVTVGTATLSATVTGLTNGTTYTFKVAASNARGTGARSAASNAVTPATVPGAPSTLTAVAGDGLATLSWSSPASTGGSPITGYVVTPYIAGIAQPSTTFASTASSEAVTGLTDGITYTFTVAATNGVGTGPESAASDAVTPSAPVIVFVPGAPTIGGAIAGDGQATVTWSAPASDGGAAITSYVVTPAVGGVPQPSQSFDSSATSGTVTGLADGTAYTFTVAATNAAGTGPSSAVSNAVTPTAPVVATVPGPPTIGTAVAGNAAATVSWSAPGSDGGSAISGYVVTPYVGTTPQAAHTFSSTALVQTVTGLHVGTTYSFTVAAINGVGTGMASAASNAVTPAVTPQVVAGQFHTCALAVDGSVSCWGNNGFGQLGNGTNENSDLPVPVTTAGTPLAGQSATQIAVGNIDSCAVVGDGSVACWGYNGYGQLGNGTTASSSVPVAVVTAGTPLAGKTFVEVAAGVSHTCALASDGTVACWGANDAGQLGDGSTTGSLVPVQVVADGALAGKTVVHITAGLEHTCAVTSDGSVVCWGLNDKGQLGNGTTTNSSVPVSVDEAGALAGKVVTAVAGGSQHTCVVTSDGAAFCWGLNDKGQLGNGTVVDSTVPVQVVTAGTPLAGKPLVGISAGYAHSCAVASDGTAGCWGDNSSGQLGDGTTTSSTVPVGLVTSGSGLAGKTVTQVAAGTSHSCAVASDGTLACWGGNSQGQLGDGSTTDSPTATAVGPPPVIPADVPGAVTIGTAIAGPGRVTVHWTAPVTDGGSPVTGYLVTPFRAGVAQTPRLFSSAATTEDVTGLTPGVAYTFTVAAINAVGTGPQSSSSNSVVPAKSPQVVVGTYFSCSLSTQGVVSCWGDGGDGELGNGTAFTGPFGSAVDGQSLVPEPIVTAGTPLAGKTIVQIAAGGEHACALTSTGVVACWGSNWNGGLGDGDLTNSSLPVAIVTAGTPLAGKVVTQIALGYDYGCAVTSVGTTACWGDDRYGELGDGGTTFSTVPVAVATAGSALEGKATVQVAAGGQHTCALASDSTVACWGDDLVADFEANNPNRFLGIDPVGVPVPTAVPTAGTSLAGKTVIQLSAADTDSCALASDGTVSCWGGNYSGELGDGLIAVPPESPPYGPLAENSLTPVAVTTAGTPLAGKAVAQISSGYQTNCAVTTDGVAACWGGNYEGQVGDGTLITRSVPTAVATAGTPLGGKVVGMVAAGDEHLCAVAVDGTLGCWGFNASGELGDGLAGNELGSTVPVGVVRAVLPGTPVIGIPVAGDSQVTVSWTAAPVAGGPPITGYQVTPYVGATALAPVTVDGSATSTVVSGLDDGTAYTFKVAAVNTVGVGLASRPSRAVTPSTVPDPPSGVVAVPGNARATVSWAAPVSNGGAALTGYVVTPYVDGVARTPVVFKATVTSGVVTGLTNGTTYTFTVAARNATGTGSPSVESDPVTVATVPSGPTVGVVTPGDRQVTVNWSAPASDGGLDVTSYLVTPYVGTSALAATTAGGGDRSVVVTGLANGTAYTFKVSAVNDAGTSAPSKASRAVTPLTTPDAPSAVAAVPGNARATVSWTAPVSNGGSVLTGYVVTPYAGSTALAPVTFKATVTSGTVTGLANGTTYTFTVAARNAAGTGSPSAASAPVRVATVPGAPAIGTPTTFLGLVTVTWTAPASDGGSAITGYVVTPYAGTVAQASTTVGAGASSALIGGLAHGTSYTFKVVAVNAAGSSAPSRASRAITP